MAQFMYIFRGGGYATPGSLSPTEIQQHLAKWNAWTSALLKAGRLNLEPLFGERAALDRFENAFTLLQGGLAGKVLLYPNGMPR